jgi:small nuclear ribonucleoprotein
MSEMTTKILEESLGKIVLVRLKGEKKLRGKLKGFDQHLNLVLEETEDITNAKKGRKLDPKPIISIPNLYPLSIICPEKRGVARIRLRTKSLYASTSAVLAKFQR